MEVEGMDVNGGVDVVVAVAVLGCGSACEATRFGTVVGVCRETEA